MTQSLAVRLSSLAAGALLGLGLMHAAPAAAQSLSASSAEDRALLAMRWAPVHHQDTDVTGGHSLAGASDYIARYDFDGDVDARNNWDNTGNPAFALSAHGYHAVVETPTHWFITYLFFHPRDWTDHFFDTEHENDAEGVLLVIARDGSTYGTLKSAVTVAHSDFFSYTPAGSDWSANAESIDGTLSMTMFEGEAHPLTAQEAKGHGLKAWPQYQINGDGVIYYPSLDVAEVPSNADDRDVRYRLLDIFAAGGMWDQRNTASLFASFGSFAGNSSGGCGSGAIGCTSNAANAPWGWDDGNDLPGRGMLATDPAVLIANYFRIPEGFSMRYTYNPYR